MGRADHQMTRARSESFRAPTWAFRAGRQPCRARRWTLRAAPKTFRVRSKTVGAASQMLPAWSLLLRADAQPCRAEHRMTRAHCESFRAPPCPQHVPQQSDGAGRMGGGQPYRSRQSASCGETRAGTAHPATGVESNSASASGLRQRRPLFLFRQFQARQFQGDGGQFFLPRRILPRPSDGRGGPQAG